jgi:probable addiction module antidote protein
MPAMPLDTLDAVAACLGAAFESGDAEVLQDAMAAVAHADGVAHLAAAVGMPRAALAAALADGALTFDTTLAIMKVIDLHRPGAPN